MQRSKDNNFLHSCHAKIAIKKCTLTTSWPQNKTAVQSRLKRCGKVILKRVVCSKILRQFRTAIQHWFSFQRPPGDQSPPALCHHSLPRVCPTLNIFQQGTAWNQSHTENDNLTTWPKETHRRITWVSAGNSFLWHCCLSYPTVLQSGSNSVVVEAFSASATSFRAWHQTQPHLPESHDRPQASKPSVYTWSIPENGFTTTCCASKQFKTPTCHNFDSSKLKSEAPVPRKEMGTRVVHVEGTNLGSVNEIHGSNAYVSKLRLANNTHTRDFYMWITIS